VGSRKRPGRGFRAAWATVRVQPLNWVFVHPRQGVMRRVGSTLILIANGGRSGAELFYDSKDEHHVDRT
jgi:hypothetical protein